jgi:ABC-type branched-subunit amino acid transport system substrate-binding protein
VAAGPSGLAPGVTGRTIKVGVYTAQGYGDFTSALGTEIALGNQQVQARAVIDYLNAHGGVAGRKVVPVFHDADLASAAANPSQEYERACTSWTQDQRVYAVVSPFGTTDDTLYECLSKAGVPIVNAGESRDSSFFQKYGPWYYQPTDMNLRRILSDNVDALHAAGFFGAHPRIAVLRADLPDEAAAVERGLKPALERHGLSLASSFAVPYDSSGGSAYYSSAVLRFQQERITHVLFAFYGSPLLFMIAAENQRYYPRYGLHSRSSPAALLQGAAPTAQQRGAMGIGWQPMNDVDSAHDPGVLNDRQALCLRLLKDAGEDTTNRATALVGLWICDNLFFLQDALRGAPTFMPAGLRAGAEALGAFRAASTFQSRLGPGRLHDGAASYRLFAFKDDCACYQYVSPEHSAP